MADVETIIRPAAIIPVAAATEIVAGLQGADVSLGGLWNATSSLWQRYDHKWDTETGGRGDAHLVGTIAVVYDQPRKNEITIYKVSITTEGQAAGWTPESLTNKALLFGGLTLATCPRAALEQPPRRDPFHEPGEPKLAQG